jgi:NAD(P)H-hydrate epimerase
VEDIEELLPWTDALVIGPGLGEDHETYEVVEDIIEICNKPMVIDADAITVVANDLSMLKGKTGVLTPHAGEFKRMTGVPLPMDPQSRMDQTRDLAKQTGFTVLLKGRIDVIACPTG